MHPQIESILTLSNIALPSIQDIQHFFQHRSVSDEELEDVIQRYSLWPTVWNLVQSSDRMIRICVQKDHESIYLDGIRSDKEDTLQIPAQVMFNRRYVRVDFRTDNYETHFLTVEDAQQQDSCGDLTIIHDFGSDEVNICCRISFMRDAYYAEYDVPDVDDYGNETGTMSQQKMVQFPSLIQRLQISSEGTQISEVEMSGTKSELSKKEAQQFIAFFQNRVSRYSFFASITQIFDVVSSQIVEPLWPIFDDLCALGRRVSNSCWEGNPAIKDNLI